MNRQEREAQLRAMMQTAEGRQDVPRLFLSCFPPGTAPGGGLMIQETPDREYGPARSNGGVRP